MTSRRAAAVAVAVLLAAAACGVRPEAAPRLLDGADATPRLPVPTVTQQPDAPGPCPPPSTSPAPPVTSTVPPTPPAGEC